MEALAALTVAAATVQFVDFGLNTVKRCREIANKGKLDDHDEMQKRAERLKQLEKDLGVPVPSSRDQKISDLGKQCARTAQELHDVVSAIYGSSTASGKAWRSVKVFSRAFRSKTKINELESRLRNHQRLLDTSMIADLRQRTDLMALRQQAGFDALKDDYKLVIARIAAGATHLADLSVQEGRETRRLLQEMMDKADVREKERFKELEVSLAQQHLVTRDAVAGHIVDKETSDVECIKSQLFVNSLHYEELEVRQEQIEEAWEGTLAFVFDEAPYVDMDSNMPPTVRLWDNFARWLREGSGLYWIEGKAGSGKSTLMSFITEHPRTQALLDEENVEDAVIVLKFFFWRSGSPMQRSTTGLLRSILLQILRQLPEMILIARQCFRAQQEPPTWTISNLKRCLNAVFPQMTQRICIFIDGLDEYEGDPAPVLDLCLNLTRVSRTKLCISSRPELALVPLLQHYPRLRLQDLTAGSIESYIYGRTVRYPLLWELHFRIIWKAEGIFLWVKLVLDNLIDNLAKSDGLEELEARLTRIPEGLDAMYKYMLSRLEPEQLEEAMLYFLFVSIHGRTTVGQIELGFNSTISETIHDAQADLVMPPASVLLAQAADRARRVQGRGCGLLETISRVNESDSRDGATSQASFDESNTEFSEGFEGGEGQTGREHMEDHDTSGEECGSDAGSWDRHGVYGNQDTESASEERERSQQIFYGWAFDWADSDYGFYRPTPPEQVFATKLRYIHRSAHDFVLRQVDEIEGPTKSRPGLRMQAEKMVLQSKMAQALMMGFPNRPGSVFLFSHVEDHPRSLLTYWKPMFVPFLDRMRPHDVRNIAVSMLDRSESEQATSTSTEEEWWFWAWSLPKSYAIDTALTILEKASRLVFFGAALKRIRHLHSVGPSSTMLSWIYAECSSRGQCCISLAYLAICFLENIVWLFDPALSLLTGSGDISKTELEYVYDTLGAVTNRLFDLLEERAKTPGADTGGMSKSCHEQTCDTALRFFCEKISWRVLTMRLESIRLVDDEASQALAATMDSIVLRLWTLYPVQGLWLKFRGGRRSKGQGELAIRFRDDTLQISLSPLAVYKYVLPSDAATDVASNELPGSTDVALKVSGDAKAIMRLLEAQGQTSAIKFHPPLPIDAPEESQQKLSRLGIELVRAVLVSERDSRPAYYALKAALGMAQSDTDFQSDSYSQSDRSLQSDKDSQYVIDGLV